MASKKDMRRLDLVVPYVEPKQEDSAPDMSGTMSSTLPMVAVVTRNKMLGWVAVLFALQSWLAETPAKRKASATPGYFSLMMSVMALVVSYMNLFLPPQQNAGATKAPSS